uniref:Uncharacterized protein n=1 Tax=Pithovirus LCPAC304 TaxID=2506594 RepID=A0A481Z8T5_9VIRU|nr:MAG: hypothetical protein LCPAC304_06550 [Pithovirus LCPAC304]
MTIDRIESVLGLFYEWSDILRLLKKIDEEKYQKYIHFQKTADSIRQNDWPEDSDYPNLMDEIVEDVIDELTYEIVDEVISFDGVDFRVFRYPHDIEYEIEHDCNRVYFVFGFVVSSAISEKAPCVRPFEDVLKNLEVLKRLIDDDAIPTFHTIPNDCNCCT